MIIIELKIAKESIGLPIIRRRVLESLGCDNREMLLAAKHSHDDDIDAAKRLSDAEN